MKLNAWNMLCQAGDTQLFLSIFEELAIFAPVKLKQPKKSISYVFHQSSYLQP